jgi:hypothetical protein
MVEKTHNGELFSLHSSPSIIRMIKQRMMRWEWHVARMAKEEYVIGGKPRRKKPLGATKYRRVENIKMDLEETGWGVVAWIGLA